MRALVQSLLISVAGFAAGLLMAGGTWLLAPPVDDRTAHAVARTDAAPAFARSARLPAPVPPTPRVAAPAPEPAERAAPTLPPAAPTVAAVETPPEPPAVAAPAPAATQPPPTAQPTTAPPTTTPLTTTPTTTQPPATLPAWKRFAAVTPDIGDRPVIAIVLDDVGLNPARARRSIALPGPITIALLPYGRGLPALAAEARQSGHELLVHMPMEPLGADKDPGPNALLVDLPAGERARRLDWNLSRFSGYVGINNHMGSRFTASSDHMRPVMRELKSRGLLFLDSITSVGSVAGRVASESGVPTATRDIFLDHHLSMPQIRRQLRAVERMAQRQGHAVAIGHPHAETLQALEAWLPTLRDRGFVLVPVSAIVSRRMTG